MAESPTDPSGSYQAVRDELLGALDNVDSATAAAMVPAAPLWTVKDTVAHLCGLNAEFLAEVQGGLGSDEATNRQVSDRSAADLAQVVDEWRSLAEPIGTKLSANPTMATALLADLVIHVFDLAEVLHQPTGLAAAATPASAHRYIPLLQERVAEQLDVALTVELDDGTRWPAPSDRTHELTVRTDPHSFLRGVTGRLTRNEVESFTWSADPTAVLDQAWNQYGPFRV